MFILYISHKFLSTLPPILLPSEPNLIIYPRNIEFSKGIISLCGHINKSGLVRSKLGHTFHTQKDVIIPLPSHINKFGLARSKNRSHISHPKGPLSRPLETKGPVPFRYNSNHV